MDYDSRRDLLELARIICYLNSHTFKHKVALVSLKNIDYDYATDIDEKQTKKRKIYHRRVVADLGRQAMFCRANLVLVII